MTEELPLTNHANNSSSSSSSSTRPRVHGRIGSSSINLSPKSIGILILLTILVTSQFLIDLKPYTIMLITDYGGSDGVQEERMNSNSESEEDDNDDDNDYENSFDQNSSMVEDVNNIDLIEDSNDDTTETLLSTETNTTTNEPKNTSSTTTTTCPTFQNSKEWLTSPRHSNINEPFMTDEYIKQLILHISPLDTIDGSQDVLRQSLCLNDSAFRNWDKEPKITRFGRSADSRSQEDKNIQLLTFRLLFLAIHEHQYGSARIEAKMRYDNNNNQDEKCINEKEEYTTSLANANVGKFDFECPDTKFLISHVPEAGFGASLRVGLMDPMFIGLVTGRVVLYVNSFDSHPDASFRRPWPLASCPRKDMQCVYMPLSPCVLTKEEIEKGIVLPNDNLVLARRTGSFGDEYDNAKVLMMKTGVGGHQQTPNHLWPSFVNIIESFYDKQQHDVELGSGAWKLDKETLEKVTSFLRRGNSHPDLQWLPHQVTGFYLMRPNMDSREKIDKAMQKILPENFDPKTTVGFPIRGEIFDEVFLSFHCDLFLVRL
jgi:hypothetical protein